MRPILLGALTCQNNLFSASGCDLLLRPFFLFFRARQGKNRDGRQGRPAAAFCAVKRARSKAPLPCGVVFSIFWRSLEFQADD